MRRYVAQVGLPDQALPCLACVRVQILISSPGTLKPVLLQEVPSSPPRVLGCMLT